MEFVTTITGPIVNVLMLPITDRLRYMMFCKKYVRDMQSKMRELEVIIVSAEEHINHNRRSRLEIPSQVSGWLEEVEGIKANVQNFPSGAIGCFNLNTRHKLGRKALKIIDQIESFTRQYSSITWTDRPIPLGKIDSMKASTSTPSTGHKDFGSREATFAKALKALEPDHKSHMIALCGMGGVGKTTMMKRLKKVVQERKIFSYIVEAVIGEKTNPIALQDAIADYLTVELNEKTKPARADKLRQGFKDKSDGGKNTFFVILDDVWEYVDLEDIGLSPFPNQGVNFKVLLTSRDTQVCSQMRVEDDSIFNVELLREAEAQSFFLQISGTDDPELQNIGLNIVSKCRGLPIAIKTIGCTLKNKRKNAWIDALTRLQHHDDFVNEVFKVSYDNLQTEETKSIFLLCGLFPEDFNIPTENLLRYGWGLKIFKSVSTIREARNRLNTCIDRLRETNLLIKSDDVGCVKLHDLVRVFILHVLKEPNHASIVNHGSMSGTWPEEDDMINGSCKRISLTCKGMSEIPQCLNNFPNLSLLKLMQGDKSLRFPQGFYGEMKMLQVISYDQMKYPLLPSSPEFSTNLRVLHLHKCSLMMFDCSSIGNHLNLEVLSFANSEIECLPPTIRKLKKLRLLDLTNCARLRMDNGVLQNFVKLEELYMGADGEFVKGAIRLTDENYNEIRERSKNLGALEFEFFKNDVQPKKMSFEGLQRFKISVGSFVNRDFRKRWHSFGNTLELETDKDGVKESEMNKLFEKAEVLCLTVGNMKDLSDVEVESSHSPQPSSFRNLRVLVVSKCVELKNLFTVSVANTLSKLEHLQVNQCNNMEELVHNEGNGEETVTFPQLKFLCLGGLPKLLGLCHNVNKIQLPQLVELEVDNIPGFTSIYPDDKLETSSLLKKEFVIPRLEKLRIEGMKNLKEISPCEIEVSEEVNAPMLKEIRVKNCDSLVNLFPSNPMSFIHHLEELQVMNCGSIEVLLNIDLERVGEIEDEGSRGNSLRRIKAYKLGNLREVWRIKGANNSHVPITDFQFVECIDIEECKRFKNVFTPTTTNFDLGASVDINIIYRGENQIKNEAAESIQEEERENQINNEAAESIQEKEGENRINNEAAESIQEKEGENQINNEAAASIQEEEGVNQINNEAAESIKEEEFSEAGGVSWSLCQFATEIFIWNCNALSSVIPCYAAGQIQKLQVLKIYGCKGMKEVFETEGISSCEEVNIQQAIPRPYDVIMLKLPNLKILEIVSCDLLEHVFPFSALESLKQLQELSIWNCKGMKVIVKEEDGEASSSKEEVVVFPRLKSIQLVNLPEVVGFFLGMNEFRWPSLDYVRIENCPKMTLFTRGGSTAPQLKYMHTSLGKHSLGESGLNFHLPVITTTAHHDQTPLFPISYAATSQQGIPCSFHNLIEINMIGYYEDEKIIPSNELLQLQNLEKIIVFHCSKVEEVFEAGGGNSSSSHESQTTTTTATLVNLPNLREVKLDYLNSLRYIWKSNEWTVFQFPNLTTLSIDRCNRLEHVFTSSMVGSLLQLQQLSIIQCNLMEEVVEVVTDSNDGVEEEEEEESDAKTNQLIITFPRLKSLELDRLPSLKGFCLGMKEDFSFPSLDTLIITSCPALTTFTKGYSTTPELTEIEINYYPFYAAGKDINSFIKINQEEFKRDL